MQSGIVLEPDMTIELHPSLVRACCHVLDPNIFEIGNVGLQNLESPRVRFEGDDPFGN